MKSKIRIFESNILDGVMSRNKKFYPKGMSQEEINEIFLKTRINVGKKFGFDGTKIFQATHKSNTLGIDYPDGKYIVLKDVHMQKQDFWYETLPADILMMEERYNNVVLGNQTGDCPILIAEDRNLGVCAISHCGAMHINLKIPQSTIRALKKEFNSNSLNIYAYIGSCIKAESYIYDYYPTWATNTDIWKDNIYERDGRYNIDLINAIKQQIQAEGIENIVISPIDTASDPRYASHYAAEHGNQKKLGQNFVGFYYKKN